ncbi:MAG: hypothetical protein JGK26_10490 [Microcoleus sp. PH2017_27_LUM_O_A]|nr:MULTISPECIES: hypothetical protein [unclassified Microcoleus]MCC3459010.1 hypothetical protein [Microcoleus sp. PH2017_11_PCY_U_A]MCC3559548.1 hypothetical protein [Microcoleus sp. PH2017_27_LUM_O_A]
MIYSGTSLIVLASAIIFFATCNQNRDRTYLGTAKIIKIDVVDYEK